MPDEFDTECNIPSSEAAKEAIRQQLEHILLDSAFRNSKRYPSFLRFVVHQALLGETTSLKERVLGVEVFGRLPDYDSTQDPIVRVTAAEIRKRIAKYYADPSHQQEISILLPSGTYIPRFKFPHDLSTDSPLLASPSLDTVLHPEHSAVQPASLISLSVSRFSRRAVLATAAVLLALLTAGFALWHAHQRSLIDAFWAPVVDSSRPVLFCIADLSRYATPPLPGTTQATQESNAVNAPTLLTAEDTVPLLDFVSIVRPKVHSYKVQVEGQTNFTDLAQGPTILIGAFDNKWTLFLTDPLRFHFVSDDSMARIWIEDRRSPASRQWMTDASITRSGEHKDYALIARFVDDNTGQVTVVVAGLGHHGTSAAGNFILSPQSLSQLVHFDPKIWSARNFEIVVETMVVNGHAGPAHIDAVHTW
ncbi:MAG: hypothetical protein P4L10_01440 [Acidobacteriaceae bacterium]|nr:hypothetical protein [Acidobacteriaceae bacterium]